MSLIEITNACFAYREGPMVLNALTLVIDAGERVALLGPNGAGKSTLFQLLNGLLLPGQGAVRIDGLSTAERKNLPAIRRKVGMLFQDSDDQLFNTTVYREIAYGLANMKMPADEIAETVKWALQMVEMSNFIDRSPFNLSGGEKKRIALASVLAMKPQLLVLDEPTNTLDPKSRENLVALLTSLNQELGITLLFASHDAEMIPALAERTLLMEQGRICFDADTHTTFAQHEILQRLNLQLPQVALLARTLMEENLLPQGPLPLTLEEAHRLFEQALRS